MKNEYKITKELIKSWAKEYHIHGAADIFWLVFWCVEGVIGLLGLAFSIYMSFDWMIIYLCVLILAMAIFKLFIQRFIVWSKRYKLYSTTYGVSEWMRTIEFLNDEIILTDHTSINRFKYNNIKRIKESDNTVMIFMNNRLALRLYKDAFVEGSWEECKKLILENRESGEVKH